MKVIALFGGSGGLGSKLVPFLEKEYKVISIGLKRWGTMEELFNTVKFIIDNEYISGTNLRIDGGL